MLLCDISISCILNKGIHKIQNKKKQTKTKTKTKNKNETKQIPSAFMCIVFDPADSNQFINDSTQLVKNRKSRMQ